jgi:PAS domain S-box-containing protein
MQDVTERKRSQEALEQSQEMLSMAIEGANLGLFNWNLTTGKTFWAERNLRMLGYQQGDFIPTLKKWEELTHPQDWPTVKDNLDRHLNGESARFHVEFRMRNKNGYWQWLHVVGQTKESDSKPRSRRIVGVVSDITDRKALEAQLIQAQKMEAVGTLAGGIAHDFNNLLQAVLGYTEILMGLHQQGSAEYEDLGKIYSAGKRGADLVKNLLTFSRKVEPKFRVVDLDREVIDVQKILLRTIPRTIKVVVRSRDYLQEIMADPSQIGQILMNLAVNARDAMPQGGTLRIETRNTVVDEESCRTNPEFKPGPYVLLTVSDTGHGMDKQTLERIFDPFFSTKEVGKGTGLGLATVYGIVKQHNGHILCSSEPGSGTTFRIYFPGIERVAPVEDLEREAEPPRGTETILLADDEDMLLDLGKHILTSFGYHVLTAMNGKEALEIYERQGKNIALVMLDVNMPVMNGEQCLEEIRKINPKARVLIVTGFLDHVLKGSVAERLATGIVSKPYKVTQLLNEIRDVIDNR